jgi:tRNA-specific adenosine deaminase 2
MGGGDGWAGGEEEEYTEREVELMQLALKEAKGALERREVPVGAILVAADGSIVARGSNRANEVRNATRHAEIEALDQLPPGYDASELQLIVTCEPCIMCAAALSISGVGSILFGCSNHKFGGCGSVLPVHDSACISCGRPSTSPDSSSTGSRMRARGGLFESSAVELLREFYMRGNPMAPKPQRRPTPRSQHFAELPTTRTSSYPDGFDGDADSNEHQRQPPENAKVDSLHTVPHSNGLVNSKHLPKHHAQPLNGMFHGTRFHEHQQSSNQHVQHSRRPRLSDKDDGPDECASGSLHQQSEGCNCDSDRDEQQHDGNGTPEAVTQHQHQCGAAAVAAGECIAEPLEGKLKRAATAPHP